MPYRLVFFGTSDFSVPSLRALLNDPRFEIAAVVTKPDAPIGRHQILTPPPVKVLAQERGVTVFQFDKIKTDEAYEALADMSSQGDFEAMQQPEFVIASEAKQSIVDRRATSNSARDDKVVDAYTVDCHGQSNWPRNDRIVDAYVVVSYGKIIPQRILDLPKRGCVNVHGSLLPRWRGASCIQAAIAADDKKSGVTVMMMDAEMDHGDVLAQFETIIAPDETGGSLHDRLAQLGADNLPGVLVDYLDGHLTPRPQNHSQATYCKLLTRDDGRIDWTKPALEIERLIRAYHPWPGTWTEWQGKRVKILKTNYPPDKGGNKGGLSIDEGGTRGIIVPTHSPHHPIGYQLYKTKLTTWAKKLRHNQTPAEKKFWYDILNRGHFLGYKFHRQKPIGNYILDFYCPDLMLGIEIDGDTHALQKEYDTWRTKELNSLKIKILRYNNRDVTLNLTGVQENLKKQVEGRKVELDNPSYLPLSGELLRESDGLFISCGDGQRLEILELQLEGKRVMTAREFIVGHRS